MIDCLRTILWLVCVLVGCGMESANPLTPSVAPVGIQNDCELASLRCSRCHSVARITQSRLDSLGWQRYVHRMRLMPESGIASRDEEPITRCLVFRAAGTAGLARLQQGNP
jgi:hypothetical protein